ncbi:ADC synthase [Phascolomyces articulosus]|uniref:aminodeoxychorismate synthase n=1 Tax=Phascolomyces articulosus TaxID=60185 RepID=A0AAD5KQH6_9FUNG|nr:ADC synthase [Phascolomyces articulosus]
MLKQTMLTKDPDLSGLKTLIIDNYDSYTFNLLQLCNNQTNVVVIRNDQFTWSKFKQDILPHFHNIIISPGPGRPERSSDFGICTPLLEAQLDPTQSQYHRPIFGICLGHQGIAHILGAKVTYAPRIMHGRMSQIHVQEHENSIFEGCDAPFWAVRYHSLVVDQASLPESLKITAYCYENDDDVEALRTSKYLADGCYVEQPQPEDADDLHHFLQKPPLQMNRKTKEENTLITVMGFQHCSLPLWGVQFHPESVSTEHGMRMMRNFAIETLIWYHQHKQQATIISFDSPLDPAVSALSCNLTTLSGHVNGYNNSNSTATYRFVSRKMPGWIDAESIIEQLKETNPTVSWLDSSRKESNYSKMSILSIDPAFTMIYSTLHRSIRFQNRNGNEWYVHLHSDKQEDYFTYISNLLSQCQLEKEPKHGDDDKKEGFEGGLIGYFGYEMKRESMAGYVTPIEQQCQHRGESNDPCLRCMREPDAGFQFVDRFWRFDHLTQTVEACCLVKTTHHPNDQHYPNEDIGFDTEQQAQDWLDQATILVAKISTTTMDIPMTTATQGKRGDENNLSLLTPDMQHEKYVHAIDQCILEIGEGESYELCLTTRFRCDHQLEKHTDLIHLYTHYLRKNNPAPYSALLQFPSCGMTLLSSSPERFLSVSTTGVAEMKPIKGTIGRVLTCICEENETSCDGSCWVDQDEQRKQDLWQDVKERAENLMIVDLIRNDLAQVCHPSTVRVPKLMHVETYQKVHHLVSTVRGSLLPHVNSVETIRKCFPPGSMTGAPKLRSVQLLDQLEQHRPRGVYSGCLGYFSLNGSADFNVVIRTAVVTDDPTQEGLEVSVGGGGAITFLSDPEQEWKETLLKTRSVAPR